MNSQINSSLQIFLLICLLLLLCSPIELYAQEERDEFVPGSVQISVEPDAEIWTWGKPTFVTVKITNGSENVVNFIGRYVLVLTKDKDTSYASLVEIVNGNSLIPPNGKEVADKGEAAWKEAESRLYLKPGEVKTLKFDLSRLRWTEFIYSSDAGMPFGYYREVWPVPKGRYHLRFNIFLRSRTDSKGTVTSTSISFGSKLGMVIE